MNTSDQILVVDVNVIIHLEKVNLLEELINDKNIRIVDLVLFQEYEYKENLMSKKVRNIKQVKLSEKQMAEAHELFYRYKRNTVFDYYSYIVSRDNGYALLTGDWKLKKFANKNINVYGVIWYVQELRRKDLIDDVRLKEVYEIWLNDPTVYISADILSELIAEISVAV